MAASKHALRRSLNLPMAVLFGLGVTIGAGIYVLIGATTGRAGIHAPLAFILAALVMAPTAASFAELSTRMPVSAGEAEYVLEGIGSRSLAILTGLLVAAVGTISAAAIANGSAGYLRELIAAPVPLLVAAVVLIMGAIAALGIVQSLAVAGAMTLIEIGGLLLIIVAGIVQSPDLVTRLPEMWMGIGNAAVLASVLSASLLAFFAFIGFEGLANIAEEVENPQRNLPLAILLTLVISTIFYVAIAWITILTVPRAEIAAARAPLSLVFHRVTGVAPFFISAIAVVATVNGIIALMVMASRVLFGMADRGLLPSGLAAIDPRTDTPVVATVLVVAIVMLLALTFPIEPLAEATSRVTLIIFALVNAALWLLKGRPDANAAAPGFRVPRVVPLVGAGLCVALLAGTFLG